MENVKNLSVFFPCYNEEKNITRAVEVAISVLEKLNLEKWEIIIVDDGSTDQTGQIADELVKKYKNLAVYHQDNRGYGGALKTGFKEAKYEWVAFTDSDGQFDFSEVKLLISKADDADLILGYRLKRADSFLRKVFTFGWGMAARILLGLGVRDYSCGFKLIKREVFGKVQPLEGEEKVTQIELLVKAKKLGYKFSEVGVHHYPRKFGSPTGANITVVIKSILDLFRLWWELLDRKKFFILVSILLLAVFLRFYKIDGYMSFLGDEGRDVLMVKRILTTGDIPLLGPATSIGNMYLGPLYYYMMSVPMAFFWLNPVAAAGMVAMIGVLTVWLIYYLGKSWFGFWAGALSSFLYAISPVTIIYSRSSWNPNPAPFFALLSICGLYKAHKTGNFRWLLLTGIALAFAAQMHYLALILIPIMGVLWAYEVVLHIRGKLKRKNLVSGTLIAMALFLFLMSPLLIFDLKHDFMNYHAVSTFFTNRETTVNVNPLNSLDRILPIYLHNLIGRYISGDMLWSNWLVGFMVVVPLLMALYQRIKGQPLRWVYLALGIWLLVGVGGLALYKQNIYDHYLGFLNPVPYLLLGYFVYLKKRWVNIGLIILVLVLAGVNLWNSPLKNPPQNQLYRTQEIAKYVIAEAEGSPFNFALIAKSNYDAAYQFYLDMYGHKPKQVPFDITQQLFVVCEDPVCDPTHNAKQEISHFGWSKIEKESEFMGVRVYKLVHNPTGESP